VKTSLSKQCASAAALIFLGLGFHLFNASEALTLLVISAGMILFAVLALSAAFVVWQCYKRIAAFVSSFRAIPSLPAVSEIAKAIE
jgi:hypothetical protein